MISRISGCFLIYFLQTFHQDLGKGDIFKNKIGNILICDQTLVFVLRRRCAFFNLAQ